MLRTGGDRARLRKQLVSPTRPVAMRPKRAPLAGTRRMRVPRRHPSRDDVLAPPMQRNKPGWRHQLDLVRVFRGIPRRPLNRDERVLGDTQSRLALERHLLSRELDHVGRVRPVLPSGLDLDQDDRAHRQPDTLDRFLQPEGPARESETASPCREGRHQQVRWVATSTLPSSLQRLAGDALRTRRCTLPRQPPQASPARSRSALLDEASNNANKRSDDRTSRRSQPRQPNEQPAHVRCKRVVDRNHSMTQLVSHQDLVAKP